MDCLSFLVRTPKANPLMVSVKAGNDLGVDPYPPKVRLVKLLDRYGRFLDALAHAQLSKRCPCVGQGATQDLLNFTDALSVQALLSLHRTKIHERVTEKLLLLRRHRPSIECPGIPPLS